MTSLKGRQPSEDAMMIVDNGSIPTLRRRHSNAAAYNQRVFPRIDLRLSLHSRVRDR